MADKNRRKEVEALLAAIRQPGQTVPVQELIEYLRLVSVARGTDSLLCIAQKFRKLTHVTPDSVTLVC